MHDERWVSFAESTQRSAVVVDAIRRWWAEIGSRMFVDAHRLLVAVDCREGTTELPSRWKGEIAELAAETGVEITVCPCPPATSKWNTIEHRMVSYLSMGRPDQPTKSRRTVIELVSSPDPERRVWISTEVSGSPAERDAMVGDTGLARLALAEDGRNDEGNSVLSSSSHERMVPRT